MYYVPYTSGSCDKHGSGIVVRISVTLATILTQAFSQFRLVTFQLNNIVYFGAEHYNLTRKKYIIFFSFCGICKNHHDNNYPYMYIGPTLIPENILEVWGLVDILCTFQDKHFGLCFILEN